MTFNERGAGMGLRSSIVVPFVCGLIAACAPSAPIAAPSPEARVDMRAARRALLAADSGLAAAVSASGLAAGLVPELADSAFYLQAGHPVVSGREALLALFAREPASGAIRFAWHPIRVDVAGDGSLGYTWGYGTTTAPGPDGAPKTAPAGYAIVWEKATNGRWRVKAFLRNAARAALAAAPAGFESPAYARYQEFPGSSRTAEREAIIRADSAFSELSDAKGLATGFPAYAAPDGALLSGAFGPAAIGKAQEGGPKDMRARWRAAGAGMAGSLDLGFTVGNAEFRFTGDDGRPAAGYTKYLTIWKRQPDGAWKWVFDGGNGNPAPADASPGPPAR